MEIIEENNETCMKSLVELVTYLNEQSIDKCKLFLNELQKQLEEHLGENFESNPVGAILSKGRKEG